MSDSTLIRRSAALLRKALPVDPARNSGTPRFLLPPKGATFSPRSPRKSVARYAKHNANFVLVVSGSLKTKSTKKVIKIVYDFLIKAIELGSFLLLEFGIHPDGQVSTPESVCHWEVLWVVSTYAVDLGLRRSPRCPAGP